MIILKDVDLCISINQRLFLLALKMKGGEEMKFDYFYGRQAEQFSFYQIPKLLITDERFADISMDAKLLYIRVCTGIKN